MTLLVVLCLVLLFQAHWCPLSHLPNLPPISEASIWKASLSSGPIHAPCLPSGLPQGQVGCSSAYSYAQGQSLEQRLNR